MRIASLIASSTEIICALGFGDDLVGRSHECDHPEWVKRLPALTEPKLPTDGTSTRDSGGAMIDLALCQCFRDDLCGVLRQPG